MLVAGLLFVFFISLAIFSFVVLGLPSEELIVIFTSLLDQHPVSVVMSFLGNLVIFCFFFSVYALDWADAKVTEDYFLRKAELHGLAYFKESQLKKKRREEF